MADPENRTLDILRDIRAAIKTVDQKFERRFEATDAKLDDLRSRLDNVRQAITGQSVLGRYAAAEVEERLEALDKRVAALEGRRQSSPDRRAAHPQLRTTFAVDCGSSSLKARW